MLGAPLVECLVATPAGTTDLREARWSFALDQRAFGPRRPLVAFGSDDERFLGLAHTARTDPPTAATFAEARAVAAEAGVRLIDWMCCDDQLFRSSRLALWPDSDPWDDE